MSDYSDDISSCSDFAPLSHPFAAQREENDINSPPRRVRAFASLDVPNELEITGQQLKLAPMAWKSPQLATTPVERPANSRSAG